MAFYCCGIRAQDALSACSLCADIYAEDFMTDEGQAIFSHFADAVRINHSNVVRSRIFQDEIARHLKNDKNLQIINIGSGFDSRAYRLAGGRWFEIDEPAVIFHKNTCLSAEVCANLLRRIPVDFAKGELRAALRQCDPQAKTLIVIEGVFMYLDRCQMNELLRTLQNIFSSHTLICDLMDKTFITRYMDKKFYKQILALGSEFKLLEATPEQLFLDIGYRHHGEPISVVGRAREFKAISVPGFLFRTVLKSLRDGYQVHTFETGL